MKIFFIENENPARTSSGGIMSYLINLSTYLKSKDVETVLVGAGEIKNNTSSQITFSGYIPVTPNADVSNFKYIFSLLRNTAKISIAKTDIIHAQRPDMLFPFIVSGTNTNLVCSLHGAHDLAVYDKKGKIYGFIYSLLQYLSFKKSKLLIAVDNTTQQYYVSKYPWAAHKVKMIPIGIDFTRFIPMDKIESRNKFGLSAHDEIVLFVGRLEKEKNISFLIESFHLVAQQNKNAKLVIVGNGREKQKLLNLVSGFNMNNQVIFLGELGNHQIPSIINAANVFAFCSLYEGSPTVIKEALACNVPVVSVDVGDVKSVIAKVPGSSIAERDKSHFANAINNVLAHKVQYNSREAIQQFSHAAVGQQTFQLYNQIASSQN